MHIELNATHDPARRSWVESANDPGGDFPIQNLPFGLFSTGGAPRGGVALGDRIIDLTALAESGALTGAALKAAQAASGPTLAPLLAQPPAAVSSLRAALSDLFRSDGPGDRAQLEAALVAADQAELHLPLRPPAFTDFCCSIHHIRRMAALGGGTSPLSASHIPIAYNGRASSVVTSGAPVVRPKGQFEAPPGSGQVRYGPEPMLDLEVELGVWLRGGNPLSQPISVAQAEATMFGLCLLNDWSARAIQFFEMMLGPHLGKSFLTTVSPWIVTMEALAPFRVASPARDEDAPPPHLLDPTDRASGAFDIELSADLALADGQSQRIALTNFRDMYWTFAQMIAHQASSGAPLESGDLVGSGTASGPTEESRACLAEITGRGKTPILFPDGTQRVMLEDGDTVALRGRAQAEGRVAIGFGDCVGTIMPART